MHSNPGSFQGWRESSEMTDSGTKAAPGIVSIPRTTLPCSHTCATLPEAALSKGQLCLLQDASFPWGLGKEGKTLTQLPMVPQTSLSVLTSWTDSFQYSEPVPLQQAGIPHHSPEQGHHACTAQHAPPSGSVLCPNRAGSVCLSSSPFPSLSPGPLSDL